LNARKRTTYNTYEVNPASIYQILWGLKVVKIINKKSLKGWEGAFVFFREKHPFREATKLLK
jgi:hypothetical protein